MGAIFTNQEHWRARGSRTIPLADSSAGDRSLVQNNAGRDFSYPKGCENSRPVFVGKPEGYGPEKRRLALGPLRPPAAEDPAPNRAGPAPPPFSRSRSCFLWKSTSRARQLSE